MELLIGLLALLAIPCMAIGLFVLIKPTLY